MASDRIIKRRIKSARNIAQITRAMQMVSASKMRKAVDLSIKGKPYADKIYHMTHSFASRIDPAHHTLLRSNTSQKQLVVLVVTNKGLCGGLNTALLRKMASWFGSLPTEYVLLGRKGRSYIVRTGSPLIADFSENVPFTTTVPALTKLIVEQYINGTYGGVWLVYNDFVSALVQNPKHKRILPITGLIEEGGQIVAENHVEDMLIEPSIGSIVDELLFHYLENQVRAAIVEAEASEHSARMMAMKNATENAAEVTDALTLEYNKARQQKITFEIADIVTARMAVE